MKSETDIEKKGHNKHSFLWVEEVPERQDVSESTGS